MSTAYLSLGANLGDRLGQLTAALQRLAGLSGIALTRVSGVYETAPQGKADQPQFLNCVAEVGTVLEPSGLLAAIQGVEKELGRERKERWGPRLIDIDILLYDRLRLDLPELTIPHPRMHERAFVLIPLLEILPVDGSGWPGGRPALEGLAAALPDQGVRPLLDGASFLDQIKRVE